MDPRADHWWLVLLAVAAAVGFAVRELRIAEPFIDLRVFGGNVPLLATYAVYYQADPARIGASAGLLRTFLYLGAMAASTGNAVFFAHGVDTAGMHRLAIFMVGVAVMLFLITLVDRSLGRANATARSRDPAPGG